MKGYLQASLLSVLLLTMLAGCAMPLLVNTGKAYPLPTYLQNADLNQDGKVDLADLVGFAHVWGMTNTSSAWNQPIFPNGTWLNASAADFANQGRIGLADLACMGIAWGIFNNKTQPFS